MPQLPGARAYINDLPIELFHMLIREYSKVSIDLATDSVDLQRSSPMKFLLICPLWRAIGQRCQHLFQRHLVVSGHHELQQLVKIYRHDMIPSGIAKLTVILAPAYEPNGYSSGIRQVNFMHALGQMTRDLEQLKNMFEYHVDTSQRVDTSQEFNVSNLWDTLNLHHFSLYVKFSAVFAQKRWFEKWAQHWGSKIGDKCREMELLEGGEGFHDDGYYSHWNL